MFVSSRRPWQCRLWCLGPNGGDRTDGDTTVNDPNGLRRCRVLVMGLGTREGGVGAARYAHQVGAEIRVTDMRTSDELEQSIRALGETPVDRFTFGEHRHEDFEWADVVVRNPAVHHRAPWLEFARSVGCRIENDITLFLRACPSPVVGVTGTKGKTTTATLVHHFLRRRWPAAILAGNMGRSALKALAEVDPASPVVLELSSFQIEQLMEHGLSPDVAVVTNLNVDHLDRYGTKEAYWEAKVGIAAHQTADDWLVLPVDDAVVASTFAGAPGQRVTFGSRRGNGAFATYTQHDRFVAHWKDRELELGSFSDLRLRGDHSRLNVLAAAGAALAMHLSTEAVRDAIPDIAPVRHRLYPVGVFGGVEWIDDTASTNPLATCIALDAYADRAVILIAGGSDKQLDMDALADQIVRRDVPVVLLDGAGTRVLERCLQNHGYRNTHGPVRSMPDAVRSAAGLARPGSVVLLSPGMTAIGLFVDEADRGQQFEAAVRGQAEDADGVRSRSRA